MMFLPALLLTFSRVTSAGEKQGLVNVTWDNVNQVTVCGNSLTNTAATGWSGAGANSVEKIESGNGHIEWTAGNNSTRRFIGLSSGPLDAYHNGWDMLGQIEMGDDGWAWAGEAGDPYGPWTNCGPYTDTTVFKIAFEATALKYYVGGSLCRTITPTLTYPYHADVEMYTNGAPVNNLKLGGASCTPSCWSGCGGEPNGCGGTCPDTGACTDVTWTNIVGVSANGNSLSKDGGTNGDNAGANSVAALASGNGYLEFQAGTTNKRMWVGLGEGANHSAWDLKFHFDLGTDGTIWAGEMGDPYGPANYCGNYTTDTRFEIEVSGSKVKYYNDGTLCRTTSGATIPYPLYVDNSLDTVGAVLNSVRTSGFSGGGGTYCGDAVCNGTETCSTCSADCGACASPGARGFDLATFTTSFYDDFYLTDAVASEPWTRPIDFLKTCFGEPFPWENCKLHPSLTEGNNYSVKWEGTLIIPADGEYTFRFSEVDDEARLLIDVGGVMKEIMRVGGTSPNPGAPKTVSLTGPVVSFQVEYKQFIIGAASLKMHWRSRIFEEEIIPIYTPSNTYVQWPMGRESGGVPVPGHNVESFLTFGSRVEHEDKNGKKIREVHGGIDLLWSTMPGIDPYPQGDATFEAPVYAIADGKLLCENRGLSTYSDWPGRVIVIEHTLNGRKFYSLYGHLRYPVGGDDRWGDPDAEDLRALPPFSTSTTGFRDGQPPIYVRRGQQIGTVLKWRDRSTGALNPSNNHLHFEIRTTEKDGVVGDCQGRGYTRIAGPDDPAEREQWLEENYHWLNPVNFVHEHGQRMPLSFLADSHTNLEVFTEPDEDTGGSLGNLPTDGRAWASEREKDGEDNWWYRISSPIDGFGRAPLFGWIKAYKKAGGWRESEILAGEIPPPEPRFTEISYSYSLNNISGLASVPHGQSFTIWNATGECGPDFLDTALCQVRDDGSVRAYNRNCLSGEGGGTYGGWVLRTGACSMADELGYEVRCCVRDLSSVR